MTAPQPPTYYTNPTPEPSTPGTTPVDARFPRRAFLSGTATLALTVLTSESSFAHQPPSTVPRSPARPQPASTPAIPRLTAQLGHAGSITSACFSPDGRFVLTGGDDRTARLWDATTGKTVRNFQGHSSVVSSVCFSPDGRLVLTGSGVYNSRDNTARLWDIATGKTIRDFQGNSIKIRLACFSPDGRFILTAGWDTTARLWDVSTGQMIRTFEEKSGLVLSVCFSPDGRFVLTGSGDNTARLWDISTGKTIRIFQGHMRPVNSVGFSPDAQLVLTGSGDSTARLWNVATGKEIRTFEGHSDDVLSVGFSPDARFILTGGEDYTARLWDATTGKTIETFEGHSGVVNSVCFSPDARSILTGSVDGTARLWDARTGKNIRTFVGHANTIMSVCFSRDGRFLLTGSGGSNGSEPTARLWDATAGKEIEIFEGHWNLIFSVCISPDAQFVLTGSGDASARLWDATTGKTIRIIDGHAGAVYSACFSPDGQFILTGNMDSTARLWDVATGKTIRIFDGHSNEVKSVCFSPDGQFVLTGSDDKTARLWEVATGKEMRAFKGHSDHLRSVCFSPDGQFVLTGSADSTARLWDVSTGKTIRTFEGHLDDIFSVCFSLDGRSILTGSWDKTARLWEVSTGKTIRTFEGHSDEVNSVCFSPDAQLVLTGSDDGTTRLWDARTGQERCALISFKDGAWAVTTPEGRFDASNGGNVDDLFWIVGLEPIALAQLKAGFYEPGLFARVWKGLPPPFPTPDFTRANVRLYPEVVVTEPKPGERSVNIRLINRGGGIGKIRVWVDGALLTEDARPAGFEPNTAKAVLTVSLASVPALKAGQKRTVRVEAENVTGDVIIRSRGVEASYLPDPATVPTEPPHLYALIFGVSDYANPILHLKYAAKDATDFADALTLAADTLFTPARTHITLLTSDATDPAKKSTRANVVAAFEAVRKAAKATDVLVVYGAGHGVSLRLPGTNEDLYCYLTQEANTTHPADLQNAALRRTCAVTSADLAGWLNAATGIKANKKVIVLDTCAAGAAGATLIAAARELTPEEVARTRAISDLKDRTAFHVLMGCAADRVSYEAGEYGQGLLTYALLEGMAKSERFIEVPGIFEQVERRVPELARGIGGIQKPQVASPQGASIQIGEMNADGRARVHLPSRKVRILAPTFQDAEVGDALNLTSGVALRLINASAPAATTRDGKYLYVGAGELPDAVEPRGSYTVSGETATVRIVLRRNKAKIADFPVTAPARPDACADVVAKAILEACEKLAP